MKIKKPSLKGIKNCGYLGHFAQDQYIQKGHNLSGREDISKGAERRKRYREAIRKAISEGRSPEIKFDKPVSKMTYEEKMENAAQYKQYLDIWEEESNRKFSK